MTSTLSVLSVKIRVLCVRSCLHLCDHAQLFCVIVLWSRPPRWRRNHRVVRCVVDVVVLCVYTHNLFYLNKLRDRTYCMHIPGVYTICLRSRCGYFRMGNSMHVVECRRRSQSMAMCAQSVVSVWCLICMVYVLFRNSFFFRHSTYGTQIPNVLEK